MNKSIIVTFVFFLYVATACSLGDRTKELKVLQINLWHQTTAVPNGFSGLIDIIEQTDPDIVLLSEAGGKNKEFIFQLIDTLKAKGKTYHGQFTGVSAGLISKYEIEYQEAVPDTEGNGPIIKAYLNVEGHTLAVYSAHLDYTHYECYMPRGYSGTTWKKLDAPVSNPDSVLAANRLSRRDEAISAFVLDAKSEIAKGNLVLIGGDFNEPSHLDWQEDTKNLRDHNGLIINWDCSVMLKDMGMVDSYREKHPNPVTHPGITYPSANKDAEINKLTWAPEADERDRIDFIYYYPNSEWTLSSSSIVGPEETIMNGKLKEKDSQDSFILPAGVWPTDHKANMATFTIKVKGMK